MPLKLTLTNDFIFLRRTSGGVFLTLLKANNYATEDELKDLFKEDAKINPEAVKRKRALQRQRRREREQLKKQNMAENNNVEPQQNVEPVQPEC